MSNSIKKKMHDAVNAALSRVYGTWRRSWQSDLDCPHFNELILEHQAAFERVVRLVDDYGRYPRNAELVRNQAFRVGHPEVTVEWVENALLAMERAGMVTFDVKEG